MPDLDFTARRIWIASVVLALATACRSGGEDTAEFAPPEAATVNAAATPTHPARAPDTLTQAPLADGQVQAAIGDPAPDFELADLDGHRYKLSHLRGKMIVLEWFNPDCAAVIYAYGEGELREMKARHASNGIVWLTINSSPPSETGADLALNQQFVATHHLTQPILLDPTGIVGRSYGARTTPEMFVVNERGVLVYSGALDNAPRGRVESLSQKTNYVEMAIADLKSGHAVTQTTSKPYGCEIKYVKP